MKFRVYRTSDGLGRKRPCDEAYRVDDKCIGDYQEWHITICDLDALVGLAGKQVGGIVINAGVSEDIPSIEIYDDYRE